jgi:precorrin-2 dehydrogenase / sirohydrochlorin ferrochelatase
VGYIIDVQPSAGVALVVGGGAVAERKVQGLVAAGFAVQVVAPEVRASIRTTPGVLVVERSFAIEDVQGKALIFACTDSRAANAEVARTAAALGTLVLVADSQEESSFFTPAVHRDGDLAVAVSTGGADPTLARELRDRVAAALGDGWAERLAEARADREQRLAGIRDPR